jgi:hypothetical protein
VVLTIYFAGGARSDSHGTTVRPRLNGYVMTEQGILLKKGLLFC